MGTSRETTTRLDPTRPQPTFCAVGETLREVTVLSEAQWEALPAGRRPGPAEHVPGLGWVCAGRPRPE